MIIMILNARLSSSILSLTHCLPEKHRKQLEEGERIHEVVPDDIPKRSDWDLQNIRIVELVYFLAFLIFGVFVDVFQSAVLELRLHAFECFGFLIEKVLPLLKMKEIEDLTKKNGVTSPVSFSSLKKSTIS